LLRCFPILFFYFIFLFSKIVFYSYPIHSSFLFFFFLFCQFFLFFCFFLLFFPELSLSILFFLILSWLKISLCNFFPFKYYGLLRCFSTWYFFSYDFFKIIFVNFIFFNIKLVENYNYKSLQTGWELQL